MGGLGKTTLAQHVYNDSRMEAAKFDIKAWVCVSDDFDVLTVTKTILEAITNSKDDSRNLEMVHKRLKEKLSGKKVFLVLDDVWNERREEWEAVQTPLNYGAPGSRILVTTRSESVASNMRSCKVHHLKQLQEDQSWQVFAKHAFQDDHCQLDSEIKEIATKIIKKCKGLPLALKSIGCLLHTKSSVSEWRSVLSSNIWDLKKVNKEIIPALFLSYCHLTSYLKRCFAFCALFPKDFEFDKDEMISLWIAEGFLQCPQQSNRLQEVGEMYFDDLLSRSFFQQSSWQERCFKLHDLHNDLAKYVCGDICFSLGDDTTKSTQKATRHFSFVINHSKHPYPSQSLSEAKRLRTFIPIELRGWSWWIWDIPINELLSKFEYLRVLSLCFYGGLEELPEAVCKLKFLWSLDLSWTDIKRLPDSTCLLYKLQILKLNYCHNLEELPFNMHKLTSLRCLEFIGTKVREMPVRLDKLKNLQVLSTFCVGKSSESNIQQLRRLNLQGELSIEELSIEELQNIVNPLDALAVDLKNKTQLVKLAFVWNREHIPDDPKKDREVLENLQPSKYLKDLLIGNYGGTELAIWLSNNSLSNMVSLTLKDCKYCLCLPCLGLLPSLKYLSIGGFDGIVSIGVEFYGTSPCPFPSLEMLGFRDMKEWEEWECTSAFPRLEYLSMEKCPKLKGLSEQLVHVKKLLISECEIVSMSRSSLEALSVETIEHTVSNPYLEQLSVDFWGNLNILVPSLTNLMIEDCPKVEMWSEGGLPSNLKSVDLSSYKLIASLKGALRINTCLETLVIRKVDEVESFPDEGILPLSITCLIICGCPNLKKLDYKGLCQLSSLKQLKLWHCPKLECLPEEGLPRSISFLAIDNCPLLKKRCQKPEGQDWEKIVHIQHMYIVEEDE